MQNKLVACAVSDIGRVRSSNQDGGYTGYQLHFVADGMGGHAGGDIASAMVSQHVAQVDALYATTEDAAAAVLGAMLEANAKLGETVDQHNELAGMGTTFSGVVFTADKAVIAHIGDSRVYLARNGEVRQLTKDHTFVQRLVDRGFITPAEALVHPKRNVIMRVLGDTEDAPNIDSWVEDALPGDRWMMCSDGLCGYVSDEVIERNLLAKAPAMDVAQDLVGETLEAGAPDNVTVVVVDVLSPGADTDAVEPQYVGSAANDVVISQRRGRGVPMLFNPRAISDFFSRNEDPTDFVPESEEFLAKVLAETNKRIKNRRLRQVLTYLTIAAIAVAALWGGYAYTQTKFYVGEFDGRIAIFKGIKESLGPLKFSSVYEETNVELSTLTDYQRQLVDRTIFATDITDAHRIVSQVTKAVEK
jgi:protein phosphatase